MTNEIKKILALKILQNKFNLLLDVADCGIVLRQRATYYIY